MIFRKWIMMVGVGLLVWLAVPNAAPTTAQDTSDDFMLYFYDGGAHALVALSTTTAANQRTLALDALLPPPMDDTEFFQRGVAVSPDGTRVLVCEVRPNGEIVVSAANIQGAGLVVRGDGVVLANGFACDMQPAGWAADGSTVTVTVINYDLYGEIFSGTDVSTFGPAQDVYVLDADTLAVLTSTAAFGTDLGEQTYTGARVIDYVPTQYVRVVMGGYESLGVTRDWSLVDGSVTPLADTAQFGDTLPSTGEHVYPDADSGYALRNVVGLGDLPTNVLRLENRATPGVTRDLYAIGGLPRRDGLYRATFINNGEILLLETETRDVLIFRDGSIEPITALQNFSGSIIGTPTGFVTIDLMFANDTQVIHYDVVANVLTPRVLLEISDTRRWELVGHTYMAGAPALPAFNLGLEAFTQSVSIAGQCAAVAPTPRLRLGPAVVLGDTPNRLRTTPDLNSAVITTIPPTDEVYVDYGPYCSDGLAWYLVYYGALEGWTAEGADGVYFLEQVGN